MNKKAKTKAQTADEDANLDEALDESFPASDPPSMTQPRTGADVTQRKPKRPPKGEAIHRRQDDEARQTLVGLWEKIASARSFAPRRIAQRAPAVGSEET